MNATIFKITENGYLHNRQNDRLKIMVQLLQTGTDEKPSSKTVSQVLLIFYNSINGKKKMFNLELRGQGTRYVNGSLEL
jgi:hypothetical protein